MNISFLKLAASCSLKQIIKAASEGDREGVLKQSIEMKFLTGYETKVGKYHPDILCSGLLHMTVMRLHNLFSSSRPWWSPTWMQWWSWARLLPLWSPLTSVRRAPRSAFTTSSLSCWNSGSSLHQKKPTPCIAKWVAPSSSAPAWMLSSAARTCSTRPTTITGAIRRKDQASDRAFQTKDTWKSTKCSGQSLECKRMALLSGLTQPHHHTCLFLAFVFPSECVNGKWYPWLSMGHVVQRWMYLCAYGNSNNLESWLLIKYGDWL